MLARTRVTLITLNSQPAGARLTRAQLVASGGPAAVLLPVLAELGLLQDPPVPRLAAMISRRTAGLPAGIGRDLAAWMTELHDGGVRTKPKSWKTVAEYSRWVRPLLARWGRSHGHLREITADDVRQAVAAVPAGSERRSTFVAVRGLFRFLHRTKRIFTNPSVRLSLGTHHPPPLLPLTETDYQRLVVHATTHLHRVALVLAAVHGARPHHIRALLRADVNLHGKHLTIAGVRRNLDDLSTTALKAWLLHRQQTWPLTANPHLLIGEYTAHDDRPLSASTIVRLFQDIGITLDRLRADRHLEEALAYGPDPLHLVRTFGISTATGMRYANEAKRLREDHLSSHEAHAKAPRT